MMHVSLIACWRLAVMTRTTFSQVSALFIWRMELCDSFCREYITGSEEGGMVSSFPVCHWIPRFSAGDNLGLLDLMDPYWSSNPILCMGDRIFVRILLFPWLVSMAPQEASAYIWEPLLTAAVQLGW